MNPIEVINKMGSIGLIASCQSGNEITTLNIIKACYKGGLRVFEMKHHREDRSFCHFKRIKDETKKLSHLILGVGGVPDALIARTYLENGAQFIMTPFLKEDMASVCRDYDKLWIPGCTNFQDVARAVALGAQVVKILPAKLLGVKFFREVSLHFPSLHLIPSGDITKKESELLKWYETDILCVPITHELFSKEYVDLKDWFGIELKAFSFT